MADHPRGTEGRMDIERRSLLKGTACLALTGLVGPLEAGIPAEADEISVMPAWNPLNPIAPSSGPSS